MDPAGRLHALNENESSDDENRSRKEDDEMVFPYELYWMHPVITNAYTFTQLDSCFNGQLTARRPK